MLRILIHLPVVALFVLPVVAAAQGTAAPTPLQREEQAIAEYQRTGIAQPIAQGDVLRLPYNHAQAVLTCAVLKTCTVKLKSDEDILFAKPADSERWQVYETVGPEGAPVLLITPRDCQLVTDLVASTDRRMYYFRLESPACAEGEEDQAPDLPYTRIVEFYYPDEALVETERARELRAQRDDADAASVIPVAARDGDLTSLDFNYEIRRDRRFPWVPEQVFDDGEHTHILLPDEARLYDRAVLFELLPSGEMRIINYVEKGDFYKMDRVLQRGVLVIGTARAEEPLRLLITKREPRRER